MAEQNTWFHLRHMRSGALLSLQRWTCFGVLMYVVIIHY